MPGRCIVSLDLARFYSDLVYTYVRTYMLKSTFLASEIRKNEWCKKLVDPKKRKRAEKNGARSIFLLCVGRYVWLGWLLGWGNSLIQFSLGSTRDDDTFLFSGLCHHHRRLCNMYSYVHCGLSH